MNTKLSEKKNKKMKEMVYDWLKTNKPKVYDSKDWDKAKGGKTGLGKQSVKPI